MKPLLFIFVFMLLQSCFPDIKVIQPEYNKSVEEISQELLTLISFRNLTIRAKSEVTTSTNPTNKLIIELEDSPLKIYDERQLEQKSKEIAKLIKKSIKNFNKFDLITILYTSDETKSESGASNLKVYAFRPNEIK